MALGSRAAAPVPDRALAAYLREVRPIPTLTREEEIALARTIEAHAIAFRCGILGILLTARFIVGRWEELRRAKRATAALSAVPPKRREKDANVRIDRTMTRVAALLRQRAALDDRQDPRSVVERRRTDGTVQRLLLKADLSPVVFGDALGVLRERRAALLRSTAPGRGSRARRAFEWDVGLDPESFLARMREIVASERAFEEARNRFLEHNLKLVIAVAKKFRGLGLPFTDLIQEGNLGLLHAVERFDHHRGHRFSTYAYWWIRQSLVRAVQNHSRTIRLPSDLYDKMFRFRKAFAKLSAELGREHAVKELSLELGRGERETESLIEVGKKPASLDAPVAGEEDRTIGEVIPDPASACPVEAIHTARLQRELEDLLAQLSPREQQVLRWRFGLAGERDHTLEEVGGRLGLSRERTRQIEVNALTELRKMAEERGHPVDSRAARAASGASSDRQAAPE